MILVIICTFDIPSDLAASLCPLSTDCIPERIISATYALELIINAMITLTIIGIFPFVK